MTLTRSTKKLLEAPYESDVKDAAKGDVVAMNMLLKKELLSQTFLEKAFLGKEDQKLLVESLFVNYSIEKNRKNPAINLAGVCRNLAACFTRGYGIEQDTSEATKLLKEAEEYEKNPSNRFRNAIMNAEMTRLLGFNI